MRTNICLILIWSKGISSSWSMWYMLCRVVRLFLCFITHWGWHRGAKMFRSLILAMNCISLSELVGWLTYWWYNNNNDDDDNGDEDALSSSSSCSQRVGPLVNPGPLCNNIACYKFWLTLVISRTVLIIVHRTRQTLRHWLNSLANCEHVLWRELLQGRFMKSVPYCRSFMCYCRNGCRHWK